MKNNKIAQIIEYFDEILPNASCELIYHSDYELLIAVMLSAQTTDKKVNAVTALLFSRFPTLEALKNAPLAELEKIIKPLGLFKNKACNIKAIANSLLSNYDGKVPNSRDLLVEMKGVGRKTANVVLAELFKEPHIAVDTHVERISKRLELVDENASPLQVEQKLEKLFPTERYILTHHQFIHFGRYYCKAQKPMCDVCKLTRYCKYYKKKVKM